MRYDIRLFLLSDNAPMNGTVTATKSIDSPNTSPIWNSFPPKYCLIYSGKKNVTNNAENAVFARSYTLQASTSFFLICLLFCLGFINISRKSFGFFWEKHIKGRHPVYFMKTWKVSIIEVKSSKRKLYKVTRRIPDLRVSETRIFSSKKKAMKQFQEWSG